MGFFARERLNKSGRFLGVDEHKCAGKVILLGVDEISPNPAQPRQAFDPAALSELAESIRLNGVLQPVLVRKKEINGSSEKPFELVAGERRLKASKLCGMETIPAIIIDASSRQSAVYAILENIQRKDLNLFEEASALRTLIVEWGVTQEEAAVKLGMAQSTIANKLRLLALSPAEQKMILDGGLTERHSRALLRLQSGLAREKVTALIVERSLNVRETDELVTRLLDGETLETALTDEESCQDAKKTSDTETPQRSGENYPPKNGRRQNKRAKHGGRVMLVKDVRIFFNTVSQAIDAMKHAGIPAETSREEKEGYIEYRVRIPVAPGNVSGNRGK